MAVPPPIVLTIAGFDPTSGAGVTADIKTIAAHGCYGVAAVTAMTVQSTQGVRRISPVAADFVAETLDELARDMNFAAVHVGLLGAAEAGNAVANFLAMKCQKNVVLDPILRSTSGTDLLDKDGLAVLIARIIPLATVMTPNLFEASIISGLQIKSRDEMLLAAEKLLELGAKAVVITGGHLVEPADLLASGDQRQFFEATHVESRSTHGTGCAFSASLACRLALGIRLNDAVPQAQEYVRSAIAAAYRIGSGVGPMNHLFREERNSGLA